MHVTAYRSFQNLKCKRPQSFSTFGGYRNLVGRYIRKLVNWLRRRDANIAVKCFSLKRGRWNFACCFSAIKSKGISISSSEWGKLWMKWIGERPSQPTVLLDQDKTCQYLMSLHVRACRLILDYSRSPCSFAENFVLQRTKGEINSITMWLLHF